MALLDVQNWITCFCVYSSLNFYLHLISPYLFLFSEQISIINHDYTEDFLKPCMTGGK